MWATGALAASVVARRARNPANLAMGTDPTAGDFPVVTHWTLCFFDQSRWVRVYVPS